MPNYLEKRLPYAYVLVVFLLVISTFYLAQAMFGSEDWVSALAVESHVVLTVMAGFCLVGAEVKLRGKGKTFTETSKGFIIGLVVGAVWLYIFLCWTVPFQNAVEDGLKILYFFWGACVEELLFRYSFPRLLWVYGYSPVRCHAISSIIFSLEHWFVWGMTPATFLTGAAYGVAEVIALTISGSFMAIVWSHTCHNVALAAGSGFSLLVVTLVLVGFLAVRKYLPTMR